MNASNFAFSIGDVVEIMKPINYKYNRPFQFTNIYPGVLLQNEEPAHLFELYEMERYTVVDRYILFTDDPIYSDYIGCEFPVITIPVDELGKLGVYTHFECRLLPDTYVVTNLNREKVDSTFFIEEIENRCGSIKEIRKESLQRNFLDVFIKEYNDQDFAALYLNYLNMAYG